MSSYYTPVIHQGTHSSRSASQSTTHSSYSPRSSEMTSSSSGRSSNSNNHQYRTAKADGYTVDVVQRRDTVVVNHHRSNPSYDEPTSDEAYRASKSHRHKSSSSSTRR